MSTNDDSRQRITSILNRVVAYRAAVMAGAYIDDAVVRKLGDELSAEIDIMFSAFVARKDDKDENDGQTPGRAG